eukprot:TRINITY_DN709_c3_g1_i1.p1 TRINITY_DN709_c3_g1~~TRINITY_DN709_c3_g1_i1.p1  ORF type:complete len:441 (+),score=56.40 TRINITY_DN709_c3_g1_i1:55-1377(+)
MNYLSAVFVVVAVVVAAEVAMAVDNAGETNADNTAAEELLQQGAGGGLTLVTPWGWDLCRNKECKLGEGDCDVDAECKAGLVCGHNNCKTMHPKEAGLYHRLSDCCEEMQSLHLDYCNGKSCGFGMGLRQGLGVQSGAGVRGEQLPGDAREHGPHTDPPQGGLLHDVRGSDGGAGRHRDAAEPDGVREGEGGDGGEDSRIPTERADRLCGAQPPALGARGRYQAGVLCGEADPLQLLPGGVPLPPLLAGEGRRDPSLPRLPLLAGSLVRPHLLHCWVLPSPDHDGVPQDPLSRRDRYYPRLLQRPARCSLHHRGGRGLVPQEHSPRVFGTPQALCVPLSFLFIFFLVFSSSEKKEHSLLLLFVSKSDSPAVHLDIEKKERCKVPEKVNSLEMQDQPKGSSANGRVASVVSCIHLCHSNGMLSLFVIASIFFLKQLTFQKE